MASEAEGSVTAVFTVRPVDDTQPALPQGALGSMAVRFLGAPQPSGTAGDTKFSHSHFQEMCRGWKFQQHILRLQASQPCRAFLHILAPPWLLVSVQISAALVRRNASFVVQLLAMSKAYEDVDFEGIWRATSDNSDVPLLHRRQRRHHQRRQHGMAVRRHQRNRQSASSSQQHLMTIQQTLLPLRSGLATQSQPRVKVPAHLRMMRTLALSPPMPPTSRSAAPTASSRLQLLMQQQRATQLHICG